MWSLLPCPPTKSLQSNQNLSCWNDFNLKHVHNDKKMANSVGQWGLKGPTMVINVVDERSPKNDFKQLTWNFGCTSLQTLSKANLFATNSLPVLALIMIPQIIVITWNLDGWLTSVAYNCVVAPKTRALLWTLENINAYLHYFSWQFKHNISFTAITWVILHCLIV